MNTESLAYKLRLQRFQEEIVDSKLDLSEKRMFRLPDGVSHYKDTLLSLAFDKNAFTTFPAGLAAFHKLTSLSMSNNELTALPPQFGELKCLTSLNLETNSITQLPAEFCNLVALKELYLSSNRITNLPAGMSAFVHIEQFSMESNQLQTFPDCSSWEKLKRVRLSFNALKEFPKISAKHNQLQVIELTGNEITSVPKDISSLESLETLLLSYNKIDDLPDLSPLKGSLKNLRIEGNPFGSVAKPTREAWTALFEKAENADGDQSNKIFADLLAQILAGK